MIHPKDYFRRPYRLTLRDRPSLHAGTLAERLFNDRITDVIFPLVEAAQISEALVMGIKAKNISAHLELSLQEELTTLPLATVWDEVHCLVDLKSSLQAQAEKFILLKSQNSATYAFLPTLKSKKLWRKIPNEFFDNDILYVEPTTFNDKRWDYMTVGEMTSLKSKLLRNKKVLARSPKRLVNSQQLSYATHPDSSLLPHWTSGPELSSPKYSIILPCFNNGEYLKNVIEHLARLNFDQSQFEIIIVDDGSTNSPSPLIKSVAQTNPKLSIQYYFWPKPFSEKLFRAGQSRTLGALKAKGEFLVFVDSDMLVPADFLNQVQADLKTTDVIQFVRHHLLPEFSTSNIQYADCNTKKTYIEEDDYWGPFFEAESWMNVSNFWKYTCSYGLVLSKDNFWAAGGFSSNYISYGFEDTELGYRLALMGKKFKLNKTKLYHLTAPHQVYTKWQKQKTIMDSAKVFYFNQFDDSLYKNFGLLMRDPLKHFKRLKGQLTRGLRR